MNLPFPILRIKCFWYRNRRHCRTEVTSPSLRSFCVFTGRVSGANRQFPTTANRGCCRSLGRKRAPSTPRRLAGLTCRRGTLQQLFSPVGPFRTGSCWAGPSNPRVQHYVLPRNDFFHQLRRGWNETSTALCPRLWFFPKACTATRELPGLATPATPVRGRRQLLNFRLAILVRTCLHSVCPHQ